MDIKNKSDGIYKKLEDYVLDIQEYDKIIDDNMKHVDCYYIDKKRERYIFICKVFSTKTDMLSRIGDCQDEDIVYLQGEVFTNQDIRWDMYFLIFYTGSENLSIEEYHKIENDRYFCKKLIINAQDDDMLKSELDLKLPISKSYYDFDKLDYCFDSDKKFFEILKREGRLEADEFPNAYLKSIDTSAKCREDFVKRLCKKRG